MTAIRSGIPTTFRSANFRSRLEARWAAFFDLIGWRWTYEPIDAEGYIPDFLIAGDHPFFVEVGPCVTRAEYQEKAAKADHAAASLRRDVLIVGPSPLVAGNETRGVAGLLGEFFDARGIDVDGIEQRDIGFVWDSAIWARSGQRLAIYHASMSYSHRPHGGHETPWRDLEPIEELWSEAGNRVQWHGR